MELTNLGKLQKISLNYFAFQKTYKTITFFVFERPQMGLTNFLKGQKQPQYIFKWKFNQWDKQ